MFWTSGKEKKVRRDINAYEERVKTYREVENIRTGARPMHRQPGIT